MCASAARLSVSASNVALLVPANCRARSSEACDSTSAASRSNSCSCSSVIRFLTWTSASASPVVNNWSRSAIRSASSCLRDWSVVEGGASWLWTGIAVREKLRMSSRRQQKNRGRFFILVSDYLSGYGIPLPAGAGAAAAVGAAATAAGAVAAAGAGVVTGAGGVTLTSDDTLLVVAAVVSS